METGQQLKVSSDRLVKPGIEPGTPGLYGERFIHYTTAAPKKKDSVGREPADLDMHCFKNKIHKIRAETKSVRFFERSLICQY